jgi:hypothetical protein
MTDLFNPAHYFRSSIRFLPARITNHITQANNQNAEVHISQLIQIVYRFALYSFSTVAVSDDIQSAGLTHFHR